MPITCGAAFPARHHPGSVRARHHNRQACVRALREHRHERVATAPSTNTHSPPVHIPPAATGKNATDMKLAVEAMDLLHRGQIEGFCIASSDSDFTTLASRIREDGVSGLWFRRAESLHGLCGVHATASFTAIFSSTRRRAALRQRRAKHARLPVDDILAAIDDLSGGRGLGASRRGRPDTQQAPA